MSSGIEELTQLSRLQYTMLHSMGYLSLCKLMVHRAETSLWAHSTSAATPTSPSMPCEGNLMECCPISSRHLLLDLESRRYSPLTRSEISLSSLSALLVHTSFGCQHVRLSGLCPLPSPSDSCSGVKPGAAMFPIPTTSVFSPLSRGCRLLRRPMAPLPMSTQTLMSPVRLRL